MLCRLPLARAGFRPVAQRSSTQFTRTAAPFFARSFSSQQNDVDAMMKAAIKRKADVEADIAKQREGMGKALPGTSGLYASAILKAATEAKGTDLRSVSADLESFDSIIKSHVQLRMMLSDPAMSAPKKKEHMTAAFKEAGFKSKFTTDTLSLLMGDGVLTNLGDISRDYKILMLEHLNEVEAEVTSAVPLTKAQLKKVEAKVGTLLEPGQKLVLTAKVDPTILGGLTLRVADKAQDISVRFAVGHLSNSLRESLAA